MIKALKYALASSILLISTTQTYAKDDCTIHYYADDTITSLINEKGLKVENYDRLCKLLKSANASVKFDQITQISPYQTTAAVSIRLQADEFKNANLIIYSYANNWMRYEEQRTSSIEKENLYNIAMAALNAIDQKMVDNLDNQRAAIKRYKATK